MKQSIAVFFCLLISINLTAQKKASHWSIGTNPFSLGEPGLTAGVCGSYTFSQPFQLWSELSVVVRNNYFPDRWKNLRGYRFIIQPRYGKTFFVAPEFRIKGYGFNNTLDFTNTQTGDILANYKFRETQVVVGGALVFGAKVFTSKQHRFSFELTAGIGANKRMITRKNIPAGYSYEPGRAPDAGLSPHYEYDNDGTAYVPLGCRLMWRLGK